MALEDAGGEREIGERTREEWMRLCIVGTDMPALIDAAFDRPEAPACKHCAQGNVRWYLQPPTTDVAHWAHPAGDFPVTYAWCGNQSFEAQDVAKLQASLATAPQHVEEMTRVLIVLRKELPAKDLRAVEQQERIEELERERARVLKLSEKRGDALDVLRLADWDARERISALTKERDDEASQKRIAQGLVEKWKQLAVTFERQRDARRDLHTRAMRARDTAEARVSTLEASAAATQRAVFAVEALLAAERLKVSALEAEKAALTREAVHWHSAAGKYNALVDAVVIEKRSAQARIAKLEEALREVVGGLGVLHGWQDESYSQMAVTLRDELKRCHDRLRSALSQPSSTGDAK